MELYEDIFLRKSRKLLFHKGLSGFYGFIRKYEIRPAYYHSKLHFDRPLINILIRLSIINRGKDIIKKKLIKRNKMFCVFGNFIL